MSNYQNEEYILVLENRSACKSEQEVGKLLVVSREQAKERNPRASAAA